MSRDFKIEEFHGVDYKHFGDINGYEVYMNASWPDLTEQKLAAFLGKKDRAWMTEHIGENSNKHFRRAEPAIDPHFYRMEHPKEGDHRSIRVLVDRS